MTNEHPNSKPIVEIVYREKIQQELQPSMNFFIDFESVEK